jgi:hypothetical protein
LTINDYGSINGKFGKKNLKIEKKTKVISEKLETNEENNATIIKKSGKKRKKKSAKTGLLLMQDDVAQDPYAETIVVCTNANPTPHGNGNSEV